MNIYTRVRNSISTARRAGVVLGATVGLVLTCTSLSRAQQVPAGIRVGEKITYSISFGPFANVGYAELSAVSRGKLGETDAVEIRSKFKTLEFFSAAFYSVDETRTVFADASSGLPLYVSSVQRGSGLPRETISNYTTIPAPGLDLVTFMYRVRTAVGNGAATISENGKLYGVTMQSVGAEKVKTEAGEFDTTVAAVQSDYLTEHGLKDLRINLTSDQWHVPVLMRVKTAKGEFKISAISIQTAITEELPVPVAVPTPVAVVRTMPRPVPTPAPYVNNVPLAEELVFDLGETLEYRLTMAGQPVGAFTLQAKERRQVEGRDTLLLTATATRSEPGNRLFAIGDSIATMVDPDTLAPRRHEMRFNGTLNTINQTAVFDAVSGSVSFSPSERVDAPIGTHSLLSLLYALRSFNLKPSRDLKNPVNDTRVAVVWDKQPYIFSLRPSEIETITLKGEKIRAQKVSITAGGASPIDMLQFAVWLSTDGARRPLMMSLGGYQAELISSTNLYMK